MTVVGVAATAAPQRAQVRLPKRPCHRSGRELVLSPTRGGTDARCRDAGLFSIAARLSSQPPDCCGSDHVYRGASPGAWPRRSDIRGDGTQWLAKRPQFRNRRWLPCPRATGSRIRNGGYGTGVGFTLASSGVGLCRNTSSDSNRTRRLQNICHRVAKRGHQLDSERRAIRRNCSSRCPALTRLVVQQDPTSPLALTRVAAPA